MITRHLRNCICDLVEQTIEIGSYLKIINSENGNWIIVKLIEYIETCNLSDVFHIRVQWISTSMICHRHRCENRDIGEIGIGIGFGVRSDMIFIMDKDEVMVEIL